MPDVLGDSNLLGGTLVTRLRQAAALRQALEIKPDFAEAHINLGNTLKDLGRLDEAETNFRRALQIKPDFAMAHSNLGFVLSEKGKLDEAIASYRRALSFNRSPWPGSSDF